MVKPDFYSKVGTAVPQRTHGLAEPETTPDWASIAATAAAWERAGDAYFPVREVCASVPPGAYRCRNNNRGPFIEKMPVVTDELLHLPDGAVEELLAEFRMFWTLRENFQKHGFLFKRGLLLYGPPASGKTSAIWQMTQEIVDNQGGIVVFIENPDLATVCLSLIRRIEPKRPLITVLEDLDALVDRHGEHGFLALLDGETQISNVCHVATTNYPERLDRRFVDRPSRFDTVKYVGMPSAAARAAYLTAKAPDLDAGTRKRWVKRSEDYSIAHLREVVISVLCFEQDEDTVFERLEKMMLARPESDGFGGTRRNAGFL